MSHPLTITCDGRQWRMDLESTDLIPGALRLLADGIEHFPMPPADPREWTTVPGEDGPVAVRADRG